MTDATTSAAPIDVPRLRAALCRARRIMGGNLLLIVVWLALEAASDWRDGSTGWAAFFGVFAAIALVAAVHGTVTGNKTDDARAAGPTDEFVAHCRATLVPVAGGDGLNSKVFLSIWAIAGAFFLFVALGDVVGETPPRYLQAASQAMLAVALFLRPLWNRWRNVPEMARELATLPPPSPPAPPSTELVERTRDLLAKGEKIQAIKNWRTVTGVGLKDAKDAVDAIERSAT